MERAERRKGRIRAAFAAVGGRAALRPTPDEPEARCSAGRSATGQVTVELLLALPVFMLMLFLIMELGNLAFQTILAHHSAYELARIGSLVAGPRGGEDSNKCDDGKARLRMKDVLYEMFPARNDIVADAACVPTGVDRQVQSTGRRHQNHDLQVTLSYPARLVFPGANYILSDPPQRKHSKMIKVVLRMPVEKPFFQ